MRGTFFCSLSVRLVDLDVGIPLQAGAGGDLLADDDVFLQAQQRVGLALDGCFGQHAGGLLEGGRGQEALGGQGGLGDAQQQMPHCW